MALYSAMRRRDLLASGTALLAALAGCGHPDTVLDMDEASDDDIVDKASTTVSPDSDEYDVVSTAVANGTATRTGSYELFDRTDTVQFEGTFYEVSETRLASSEVTVYEVLVDFDPEDTTPELGAIEFGDLPEADRRRLEPILSEDDHPEGERYDAGVDYGSAAEVGGESVFVPDRQYDVLVHEGDRYRVAVNSRTASEAEYRYEVTEVAADVETYADQVREEYLFTLSGLSEAEREVVEEAIAETYFGDGDAFRSVVDRLQDQPGFDVDDFYGTWLLTYDGTEYVTYARW